MTCGGAVGCWLTLFLPRQPPVDPRFPPELTQFAPHGGIRFAGAGGDAWDRQIRERGFILKEGPAYHLWYTGYRQNTDEHHLGYATSPDGLTWMRHPANPIHAVNWVEDVMVVKHQGTYHMVAEGRDDVAHLLTSTDRVRWREHGPLDIRYTTGRPLTKGPYGTPTLWREGDVWYLFYERNDEAVWLATSRDLKRWTNVRDSPVLTKGPAAYDRYGLAVNQIIRYRGRYYAYYHGTAYADWREWTTNVAVSTDLIHWTKWSGNPVVGPDHSSGILVHDGQRYRLYVMHPAVRVFLPRSAGS